MEEFTYGIREILSSKWGARGFDVSPTLEFALKQTADFRFALQYWVKPVNSIQGKGSEMEYSNQIKKKMVETADLWRTKLHYNIRNIVTYQKGLKGFAGASLVIQNVIQEITAAIRNAQPPLWQFLLKCTNGNIEEPDSFKYYLWVNIAKRMGGRELSALICSNKWFRRLHTQEIWKSVFLRDSDKPVARHASFSWSTIYKAAFLGGSHSFSMNQKQHIEWIGRIGFFYLDYNIVVSTGSQNLNTIDLTGKCILNNPRMGIWVADLHWVPCVFCIGKKCKKCKDPSIVLVVSHVELFLEEGFENNTWQYQQISAHIIPANSDAVIAGIFDPIFILSKSTSEIFSDISWIGPVGNPRGIKRPHAVAVGVNLPQPNKGVLLKYEAMRDEKGEIVSIRTIIQLI